MPGENPFAGYTGHEMLDYITHFPYGGGWGGTPGFQGHLKCSDGTELSVISDDMARSYLGECVEVGDLSGMFPGVPQDTTKTGLRLFFHVDPKIVAAFIEEHGGEDGSFVLPDHVTN